MAELSDRTLTQLRELLSDAEACIRLSQWEEEFCGDMRDRVLVHGAETKVSDKQWAVLRRIEGKVYA